MKKIKPFITSVMEKIKSFIMNKKVESVTNFAFWMFLAAVLITDNLFTAIITALIIVIAIANKLRSKWSKNK